jgi:hypothetical protein
MVCIAFIVSLQWRAPAVNCGSLGKIHKDCCQKKARGRPRLIGLSEQRLSAFRIAGNHRFDAFEQARWARDPQTAHGVCPPLSSNAVNAYADLLSLTSLWYPMAPR